MKMQGKQPPVRVGLMAPLILRHLHSGSRRRLLAMALFVSVLPAHATPPPPPAPPLLRKANMTVRIELIEASNGVTRKISELCKVSGKIPVYSDDGWATSANLHGITGCKLPWKGRHLDVSVRGAKAISKGSRTFVTALVSVDLPGALPACSICGPQPLADSRVSVRVSGKPRSISFKLYPNPISMLNAKPTVWLEADVDIVD